MKIRIRASGHQHLRAMNKLLNRLASDIAEDEAMRGLIDAGRKVKSKVAKAATKQAAFRSYAEVSPFMRGVSDDGRLTYRIFAPRDGQPLDSYKGLRVLAMHGRAAGTQQAGRDAAELGSVRSGVWNAPRIFKRSFATERGTFAVLPGGEKGKRWKARGSALPPALWTYGKKEGQPRDGRGRFAAGTDRPAYGKIRRLYGPALRFEVVQGEALDTFDREAPMLVKQHVEKRLIKIMKF